jgi:DNA-binding GntR family transcriptional regulator
VSVGTTHRAVALLRDEGLIDVARGRRAVVVGLGPTPNLRRPSAGPSGSAAAPPQS